MGLVASTPYLLKAFLGPVGGIVADMVIKGGYLSVRAVRILFYAMGKSAWTVFLLKVLPAQERLQVVNPFVLLSTSFFSIKKEK